MLTEVHVIQKLKNWSYSTFNYTHCKCNANTRTIQVIVISLSKIRDHDWSYPRHVICINNQCCSMQQHPGEHDCGSFLVGTLYYTDQIYILRCICWLRKHWCHCRFIIKKGLKSHFILSFMYFKRILKCKNNMVIGKNWNTFLVKLTLCELGLQVWICRYGRVQNAVDWENSAVELKPNPNFIPDFKLLSLNLTLFCIYILHSTFDQRPWNVWITQLTFFPVFHDITKQILTVSLSTLKNYASQLCSVTLRPSALGHNFSVLTSAPVKSIFV